MKDLLESADRRSVEDGLGVRLADATWSSWLTDPRCRAHVLHFVQRDSRARGSRLQEENGSCVHRGDSLRVEECESCSGTHRLKIDACAIHGECSLSAKASVRHCGPSCGDHTPANPTAAPPKPGPGQHLLRPGGKSIDLRDFYRDRSAFLVCGGPSAETADLEQLQQRGILVAAVNNAATLVRPQIWIGVDEPRRFVEHIFQDPAILKLLPWRHRSGKFRLVTGRDAQGRTRYRSGRRVDASPSTLFYRRTDRFRPERFLSENDFSWARTDRKNGQGGNSVLLPALKLLWYFGVRTVYLVGCDFRMVHQAKGEDGPHHGNYAWPQHVSERRVNLNNRLFRLTRRRLVDLEPHFAAAGFRVYNTTPGSELREVPYVDFAAAVERARLKGPLVTDGRYEGEPA